MPEILICDTVQTPFGHYGAPLSTVGADDLAPMSIKTLTGQNRHLD